MQICWKCGAARDQDADAPEWQCPACGVAYNKAPRSPSLSDQPRARGRARDYVLAHPRRAAWIALAILAALALGWWLWFKSPWSRVAAQDTFADERLALFRQSLIDPESARFREVSVVTIERDGVRLHSLCGLVNAKNRFGGYVGERRFFALEFGESAMDDETVSFETAYRDFCEGRCRPDGECDLTLRLLSNGKQTFE